MKAKTIPPEDAKIIQFVVNSMQHEKLERQYLGLCAKKIGYGGVSAVAKAAGVTRKMVAKGLQEIEEEGLADRSERERGAGAGRPPYEKKFAQQMFENLQNDSYNYVALQTSSSEADTGAVKIKLFNEFDVPPPNTPQLEGARAEYDASDNKQPQIASDKAVPNSDSKKKAQKEA